MSEFANSQSTHLIAQQVGNKLLDVNAKLAIAESCTGGGIAQAITAVAGSSQWFEFGYITYANKAKKQLLNVDQKTIDTLSLIHI